jgi:hypothetical protein
MESRELIRAFEAKRKKGRIEIRDKKKRKMQSEKKRERKS